MVQSPRTASGLFEVYTRSIPALIQELLDDPCLASNCHWRYNRCANEKGEREINDLYSSNWWCRIQNEVGEKDVLAVIVGSDETHVSFNGRKCAPVYLTLGNIPIDLRKNVSAKRLMGFLPIVVTKGSYKRNSQVTSLKRNVHNRALSAMLDPIRKLERTGLAVTVRQSANQCKTRLCQSRMAFIVADHAMLFDL